MYFTPIELLQKMTSNPTLLVTGLLIIGVILVNGWTDAPNAIATCISTRTLGKNKAIIMAAAFNFLGLLTMTLINNKVAQTIYKMADFKGDNKAALIALCAAMIAIMLWAAAALKFGIPTSEGHALIAGITGAAIALQGGLGGINPEEWLKVIYGLIFSVMAGFFGGYLGVRVIEALFWKIERRKASAFFEKAQISASAAMAFMHGAQDGQKFIGIFLLGTYLAQGQGISYEFKIPVWIIVFFSAIMAIGTAIGGVRIIKKVGLQMVKLEAYQGFSADIAATTSLLVSSLLGFPVSTTHTKTTAIMGVGMAKKMSGVRWSIVKEMAAAWILTFPGCGIIGFMMAWLFLKIF